MLVLLDREKLVALLNLDYWQDGPETLIYENTCNQLKTTLLAVLASFPSDILFVYILLGACIYCIW